MNEKVGISVDSQQPCASTVSTLCALLGFAAFGVDVNGSYQTLSLTAGESYSLTGDATISPRARSATPRARRGASSS